ncbi:ATP-binding protein [Kordiimonas sp.]|uniref:ATP-binding protein n=1 Tax=Kordiimonas sp. TaxID=1970157 RepID=UPI003A8D5E08
MSRFRKNFLFWLTLGLLIIALGATFAAKLAVEAVNTQLGSGEQLSVKLTSQYLREALAKPASHVRSIALLEGAAQNAFQTVDGSKDPQIENAFKTLLLRNPEYLQARWIGEDGLELARVDRRDHDTVFAVPTTALQDKSERSYVRMGLTLGRNELYVSPLDLNVENKEIQVPYVPVVRMALRIFTRADEPNGIFVLNIGAQDMLDHLVQFSMTNNQLLLNSDGYWLKATDVKDEWGFMFGHTDNFATRHPDAWTLISANSSGQHETADGLWTWETVSVAADALTVRHNIALKSLTMIDAETLWQARWAKVAPILLIAAIIGALYCTGLYRLLREVKNRHIAEREALAASDAKSSFLATMSHEIRTPMAGIIGLSDMLMEGKLSEENLFKVKRIKETGKALLRIINDILDLSKLDAGKFVIEKISFRPLHVADDVVRLFYMTCPPEKKSKLHITAHVEEGFPEIVKADPTRLRQVLVNLVGNAVKFTDEGNVSLVCAHDAEKKQLIFKVVDTGIGMNEDTAAKLFQDFVQADASISRKYHGTGLGLSVCKRLVECMGGEISVSSEMGKGSCFRFSIPYEEAEPQDEIEDNTITADMHLPDVRALSILVAEDNEINQMIIKGLMKKLGHDCVIACDGKQAVEKVKEEDFDLVLMDVRMPFVSGPEATRMIRQLPGYKGRIPVIALTADLIAENKASYLAAGMNDCVGKPIDQAELEAAIAQAVCSVAN